MKNITKIEFSPRASGTTTNIRKEIMKMGCKLNDNFLFISSNRDEVNYMMDSLQHLFPKGDGHTFRKHFTTYNQFRYIRGIHPERVFCDNISAERLFKIKRELPALKNVEMYGSIDQYVEDCYKDYAYLKQCINSLESKNSYLEQHNSNLEEHIKDLDRAYRYKMLMKIQDISAIRKDYDNAVNTIFKTQNQLDEVREENEMLWEQIAKLKKRGDKNTNKSKN